jgi:hypothetical protein
LTSASRFSTIILERRTSYLCAGKHTIVSTNFYWVPQPNGLLPTGDPAEGLSDMDPRFHLGLRYGIGRYCWDCKRKVGGSGNGVCLQCNANSEYETEAQEGDLSHRTEEGISGREIPLKRRGVGGACGFNWAQDPKRVYALCAAMEDEFIVADEYNRVYTGKQFLEILAGCPVQATTLMGKHFS